MNFTPAQAVERTGCSLDTVRYYEKIGLLSLGRDSSGRRTFTQGDLDWIGLLRCLRETGMPIADMVDFATSSPADPSSRHRDEAAVAAHRLELLQRHDLRVAADLARLQQQRARLQEKIAWYSSLVDDSSPE